MRLVSILQRAHRVLSVDRRTHTPLLHLDVGAGFAGSNGFVDRRGHAVRPVTGASPVVLGFISIFSSASLTHFFVLVNHCRLTLHVPVYYGTLARGSGIRAPHVRPERCLFRHPSLRSRASQLEHDLRAMEPVNVTYDLETAWRSRSSNRLKLHH